MIFNKDYSLVRKSGLFDAKYYLRSYADVRQADINPLTHFMTIGWREGRNPSSYFNTQAYCKLYPDLIKANVNPLLHYLSLQKNNTLPVDFDVTSVDYDEYVLLSKSGLFDEVYYRMRYLKNQQVDDALLHFMQIGWQKGYSPSRFFDVEFYLNEHLDIKNAKVNPLVHYIMHGKTEGRLANNRNRQGLEFSVQNKYAIFQLSKRRKLINIKHRDKVDERERPIIDVVLVLHDGQLDGDLVLANLAQQYYMLSKINLFIICNDIEFANKIKNTYGLMFNYLSVVRVASHVNIASRLDLAIRYGSSQYIIIINTKLLLDILTISHLVDDAIIDYAQMYAMFEARQMPFEQAKYYDPVTLETNLVNSTCVLIRRAVYEDVGGYDELFVDTRDIELSYRMRATGYHLKYCPSAIVYEVCDTTNIMFDPANQILENSYLRLRYGNRFDILAIFRLYLKFNESCHLLQYNTQNLMIHHVNLIIKNFKRLTNFQRKLKHCYQPFRGLDYELSKTIDRYALKKPMDVQAVVTVIVRTYQGRERFLSECLCSIANQTYVNIEVVVVEDGGNYMQNIVGSFQDILHLQYFALNKVGRSAAGNFGLRNASGVFCVFLDDDDLFFADHIEVLLAELVGNHEAVAAYSLAFEVATDISANGEYREISFGVNRAHLQSFDYEILSKANFLPIQSVLFKRTLFIERGGFDESLTYLEDWNLWLRYAYNNYFVYCPKITSLYKIPANVKMKTYRESLFEQAHDEARQKAMDAIAALRQ